MERLNFEVILPEFKAADYVITSYGAVGDGRTKNTAAFAKAIADCNEKGGGRVAVPAGMWLTGPIELKSNVDLHLEKGAVIIFDDIFCGVVPMDELLRKYREIAGRFVQQIAKNADVYRVFCGRGIKL